MPSLILQPAVGDHESCGHCLATSDGLVIHAHYFTINCQDVGVYTFHLICLYNSCRIDKLIAPTLWIRPTRSLQAIADQTQVAIADKLVITEVVVALRGHFLACILEGAGICNLGLCNQTV